MREISAWLLYGATAVTQLWTTVCWLTIKGVVPGAHSVEGSTHRVSHGMGIGRVYAVGASEVGQSSPKGFKG